MESRIVADVPSSSWIQEMRRRGGLKESEHITAARERAKEANRKVVRFRRVVNE